MEKLKLTYKIAPEEWLEGYDIYFAKFRKKSMIFRAAIFVIPLLLFIQQIWLDPKFVMGWVCIAVCIGAIFCIFANAKMERRMSERALDEIKDDSYELSLCDDRLVVETVIPEAEDAEEGQKIAPTVIEFSDKTYSAVETEKVFAAVTKAVCTVIPKAGLSVYDTETLRDALKAAPQKAKK